MEGTWWNENLTLGGKKKKKKKKKKKTFDDIFRVERRTHLKFHTIKENTNKRVEQKSRHWVLVYKLFKVFQL